MREERCSNTLIISGLIMSALALAVARYREVRQVRPLGVALAIVYVISCLPLTKLMGLGQRDGLHGFSLLANTLISAPYLYIALALAALTYVTLTSVAREAVGRSS